MLKILHILPNDKFSPIEIFDQTTTQNRYLCPVRINEDLYFLDKNRVECILFDDVPKIVSVSHYDMVVFHSLPIQWYQWVLCIPHSILVCWVLWGYDMYYADGLFPPLCGIELYKSLTKKYIAKQTDESLKLKWAHYISRIIKPDVVEERRAKREQERLNKAALQNQVFARLDYVAPRFLNEMDLLSDIPNFKACYFPFQYSKWTKQNEYKCSNFAKSSWILLGNSSDPSNNTLDVLQLIKDRNISNRIYMPMAYGDMEYKKECEAKAKKLKLDYFIQDNMIPYDEYYRVQQNCRVSVFAHIRQQASDNIHMSLLRGSKVYMYKDSIGYQYYKQTGFIVFSIEDDFTQVNIETLLTEEERNYNRQLVLDTVSIESSVMNLNIALDKIERQINNGN